MKLADMDTGKDRYKVLLLQTPSEKLKMYLYDKVKTQYRCTADTIIELKNKKDLKRVKEVAYLDSFMSDRWLVTCELNVVSSFMKDFLRVVTDSTSVIYFCVASRYGEYKKFKEQLKKSGVVDVYDYYLTSLNIQDFLYLYNQFVPKSNKLPKVLYDYVYQGYRYNVSAVIDLFEELQRGTKVTSRKDISDICGLGGNSVETFVLLMLKPPSSTERGIKTVVKNRIKAGYDLGEIYGYARFQTNLINCLSLLIDLKMLIISGVVYKRVYNLPDGYDEAKLMKYQRFIWRVKEIPMSRMLRLAHFVQSTQWSGELDFARCLYGYTLDAFKYEVQPVLPQQSSIIDDYVRQKAEEDAQQALTEQANAEYERRERLEYIKTYGIIRGRELYEKEKERGIHSVKITKSKGSKGSATEDIVCDDEKEASALFREYYKSLQT